MNASQASRIVLGLAAGILLTPVGPRIAHAWDDGKGLNAHSLALRAISDNDTDRAKAIEALRAMGPRGVQALVDVHADILPLLNPSAATPRPAPTPATASDVEKLRAALDQVAQQRNAARSLLYWYTDLGSAKAEAKRTGKPILSLRMLGKLTDEYSCANSRFFRTVLYANKTVSDTLRETFVLHWSSERPVPVVTVDYGDGRVLKRTMMGNSAHYVLDANGRPVDVLPGLYGPKAFLAIAVDAAAAAREMEPLSDLDARTKLVSWHHARLRAIQRSWTSDLAKVGGRDLRVSFPTPGQEPLPTLETLNTETSDGLWNKIAALRPDDTKLDDTTRLLVRREQPAGPPAVDAMRLAEGKARVEMPLLRVVQASVEFERNLALDTVRNEYRLHSQVHRWFALGQWTDSFTQLNERVYGELFLTPASDPWMGLAPPAYTGLNGAGLSAN